MPWVRHVIVILVLIEGGWLLFDGGRALIVGDYVTPSGRYAGQLGPWSYLVAAIGIEPRSTLMKSIHVGLGLALMISGIGLALRKRWGWWGVLLCAILGLWYLPFGTILNVALIVLLIRNNDKGRRRRETAKGETNGRM